MCGTFGAAARGWLHALARQGIRVWQVLPLAPPDGTGSPYSSPSSFAINPWLLDAQDLSDEGFITPDDVQDLPQATAADPAGGEHLDFALAGQRADALARSLRLRWAGQPADRHEAFQRWCIDQHVGFVITPPSWCSAEHANLPWWARELAVHRESALSIGVSHTDALLEQDLQWHLDRQWRRLRALASDLGVEILGDLPFYVARDSADVWSNRSLFSIAGDGRLHQQSGVPPDYFSATGQLWGTPATPGAPSPDGIPLVAVIA